MRLQLQGVNGKWIRYVIQEAVLEKDISVGIWILYLIVHPGREDRAK
jgi:hypothetical protein